jgi:hypothetical protein
VESVVKNRRQLTAPPAPSLATSQGAPDSEGTHAMRRGGARSGVTARVRLQGEERAYEGWALNVSRGGVRLILEEQVQVGEEYGVTVGDVESSPLVRRGRVVWLQQEADGVVVGLEFIGVSGSERPVTPVQS